MQGEGTESVCVCVGVQCLPLLSWRDHTLQCYLRLDTHFMQICSLSFSHFLGFSTTFFHDLVVTRVSQLGPDFAAAAAASIESLY